MAIEETEQEPEPEILHADDEMKLFKELIVDMGEGDVRSLLYNTIGKLRVEENYALGLFRMALSCGIVSCYGIDSSGWRVEGLSPEEVTMRMIYDKPVFFVSMMAPPRDMAKEVREKLMRKKIAGIFKETAVTESQNKLYCDDCGEDGAMHVAVDGNDENLCEDCCRKISLEGRVVTSMECDDI